MKIEIPQPDQPKKSITEFCDENPLGTTKCEREKKKRIIIEEYRANWLKLWFSDGGCKKYFTMLPNYLLYEVVSGKFSLSKLRILLFVARMTFGFRREESSYLGIEDFRFHLKMASPQISKNLNQLIDEGVVFRGRRIGNKYKFAINKLRFGLEMKHYRIGRYSDAIDGEDVLYCLANDKIVNCKMSDDALILYSPKGRKEKKGGSI